MFRGDCRDELVTLLGFSEEDTANLVSEVIVKLKVTDARTLTTEEEPVSSGVKKPVVTFVELD